MSARERFGDLRVEWTEVEGFFRHARRLIRLDKMLVRDPDRLTLDRRGIFLPNAIFAGQEMRDDFFLGCLGFSSSDIMYQYATKNSPSQKATHTETNSGSGIDIELQLLYVHGYSITVIGPSTLKSRKTQSSSRFLNALLFSSPMSSRPKST